MKKYAALFPGQGSQFVGMGADWLEQPAARARYDEAAEVLGYDLAGLCRAGPEEELNRSDRAQPAIFVHSVVCYEAWRAAQPGAAPAVVAGLSSGEWAALFAAGVLDFASALRALEARGRLMQAACEARPGAMLSVIGLGLEAVQALAAETGAEVANLNAPGQIVLSGAVEAIDRAEAAARPAGARMAVRLRVAGAYHSSLMAPAAAEFAARLADLPLQAPRIPVLSNVSAAPHGTPAEIRDLMVRQITSSVRWYECVGALRALGAQAALECGPGKVLAGLIKRIDKQVPVCNIQGVCDVEGVAAAWG
ncbi:MAG: ACP S-malonyltransferase [Candidatus Marinimicrobia bacterium]|nr:ACP S-malonyltransferase [Candidatus Neomarinimicrobiota bacterium]